ncbi:hypothetical protein EAS64_23775 [Trebonia kvetii]|uniref:Glycosyl hydrolase family 12 n=1 Tax=Trebonia kvetii TaxID=2480626 RepID=A0A6P2BWB0_9ACTN|nr:hypothetical protein [Trebonia kvetii]TVZ03419.1 hypothetical protein EAS64_23775 [Trebonia kvetii]
MPQVTLDRRADDNDTTEPAVRRGRHRSGRQAPRHPGRVAARPRRSRSVALLALTGTLAGGGLTAIGILASGGGDFVTTGAVALRPSAVASLPGAGSVQGAGKAIPTMPQFDFAPSPVMTAFRARKPSALRAKPTPTETTPTASPTPTSAQSTPTPPPATTPTATPPPVGTASCKNPVFTTSTLYGTYTALPYFVANNEWNAGGSGLAQTLDVCAPGSWSVTAAVNSGSKSVKTYPNVHRDFNSPAISSLKSVTSTFAESEPAGAPGAYENAYDIWLNGIANPASGSDEVMIWNENHGQIPGGSPQGTVTFDGHAFTVWKGDGNYFAFVANSTFTSGTLNLRAFFQYLMDKGWIPGNSTLSEVCYGVEVVNTTGAQETFNVTNFSVDAS